MKHLLDLKFIRSHQEIVKEALAKRSNDFDLEQVLVWDERRRSIISESEKLKNSRNTLSQEVGRLKAAKQDATELMDEVRGISRQIKEMDQELADLDERLNQELLLIPNIPHETVPVGTDEEDNVVLRVEGEPPQFSFEPQAHWDIGENLDILDFTRGVKIAGSRFTVLKGWAAKLERAIVNFMLDLHTTEHGYTEIFPPFLVNRQTMTGTGQLPKFEEDLFLSERDDLFLIPTAEVPVTNLYSQEILPGEILPIYHTAYTACFRAEAVVINKRGGLSRGGSWCISSLLRIDELHQNCWVTGDSPMIILTSAGISREVPVSKCKRSWWEKAPNGCRIKSR